MDVNSGKSTPHSLVVEFTLKHNTLAFLKCIISTLEGFQARQIYCIHSSHKRNSQTQRKGNSQRNGLQTKAISALASLFIISFPFMDSAIRIRWHIWSCRNDPPLFQSRSLPEMAHSQWHTRNSQRRIDTQSSILSVSHSPSRRNDAFHNYR